MTSCRRSLVLVLGLLLGGAVHAREVPAVRSFLLKGQSALAVKYLQEMLEDDPDDVDAWALLGAARTQRSEYPDAAVCFALGEGSERYEARGLTLHATALRYVWGGEGAATLRWQGWLTGDDDGAFLFELSLLDDLLAAGSLDEAEVAGWEAIHLRPESPAAHAFMAEVMLAQGRHDAAGFHLWQAGIPDHPVARMGVVEARLGLATGDVAVARAGADLALRLDRWNPRVVAVHIRTLLLEGELAQALEIAERPRSKLEGHPELLAARLRALHAAGPGDPARWREAGELEALLRGAHGHLPDVVEALRDTGRLPAP